MKKNTVCVYDTISKSYVEVEVSCEVYTQYNRTKLAILKIKRSVNALKFYVQLSKMCTKRKGKFYASLTNF